MNNNPLSALNPRLYQFSLLRTPTLQNPWGARDESLAREVRVRGTLFLVGIAVAQALVWALACLYFRQEFQIPSILLFGIAALYTSTLIWRWPGQFVAVRQLGRALLPAELAQIRVKTTQAGFEPVNVYLAQAQAAGRAPSALELWLVHRSSQPTTSKANKLTTNQSESRKWHALENRLGWHK